MYQSQVSILGPVGYGPTTLPLRHSDGFVHSDRQISLLLVVRFTQVSNIRREYTSAILLAQSHLLDGIRI